MKTFVVFCFILIAEIQYVVTCQMENISFKHYYMVNIKIKGLARGSHQSKLVAPFN